MKNITLYIPKIEDYYYEEKIQSDPLTMNYNAGYDVSYYGYHYDTGCIDFPEEKWEEMFNKRKKENRFFAYIKDNDINEFVGYVNYQYIKSDNRYECGILIESKYRGMGYSKKALKMLCQEAKKNGIDELYDNFEIDRANTLDIFKEVGFKVVEEQTWKKFNKEVKGVLVKIDLKTNNNEFLLMSIKTKYANQIFFGTKTFEYRTKSINEKNLNKYCIIYSSEEDKAIIGYVIFDYILEGNSDYLISKTTPDNSSALKEYFEEKDKGYALHIKEYKRFESPITLEELKKKDSNFNVPQYYRYIKQDEYLYSVIKKDIDN